MSRANSCPAAHGGPSRRRLLRALLAGALAAGGCTLVPPAGSRTYHELRDLAQSRPAPSPTPRDRTGPVVLVAVHQASALYEGTGIVYSRGEAGQSYYQLASWTERPSRRLGLLVQRRLAAAAAAGDLTIGDAALDTSGVRGDWILGLRLAQLHHDTTTRPNRAVVVVEADLLDWRQRRMIDRTVFSATSDLASEDAPAAVAAMNQALTRVLGDIERWVGERTGTVANPG